MTSRASSSEDMPHVAVPEERRPALRHFVYSSAGHRGCSNPGRSTTEKVDVYGFARFHAVGQRGFRPLRPPGRRSLRSERTLMQRSLLAGWLVISILLCSTFAYAQGVQTGTVTGMVSSTDGLPLPGVTVTATSPALQGERSTVSDTNGVYYLRARPAGTYTIDFVISNFQPSTRTDVVVTVGGITQLETTMSVSTITETITVAGEAPSVVGSVTTGQTYGKRDVD